MRSLVRFLGLAAALAASAAAAEQTLRVAVTGRPPGLGNPFASLGTPGIHPWALMFDALTQLEDDGTVGPALATAWRVETPTRWIFTLRQNVTFANGEPFTAETVRFIVDMLREPEHAALYAASEIKSIKQVDALDPLTVAIETTAPDAILDRRLSHVYMVPPLAWRKAGAEQFAMTPIGSGPYQLESWAMSTPKYALIRNRASWRASADVDRIEFQTLVDATTRMQALVADQVDVAFNMGLESDDVLKEAGMVVVTRERPPVEGIALPNIKPGSPLADVRVRRAMNHAVNTASMAAALLGGRTKPNGQGAIPEMFGFDPSIQPYPFDPARAKALLADAGYPNGFALTLVVRLEGKGPEWGSIYQTLVQDLGRIGIAVTLRATPAQEWLRMWFSGDWGGADMTPFSWTSTYRDVGRSIETVSCAKAGAFFCVKELMPRIEATAAEMNPEARRAALQAMLRELHDLAPSIYLFPQLETIAYNPRVTALPMRAGYYRFEQVTLAK